MNFIKWYLKNSWFHLSVLIGGIIYMLTWEPQLDKTVGLHFFSIILIILTIGKFRYWSRNIKK
jgi:hypothetical protein